MQSRLKTCARVVCNENFTRLYVALRHTSIHKLDCRESSILRGLSRTTALGQVVQRVSSTPTTPTRAVVVSMATRTGVEATVALTTGLWGIGKLELSVESFKKEFQELFCVVLVVPSEHRRCCAHRPNQSIPAHVRVCECSCECLCLCASVCVCVSVSVSVCLCE